MPLPHTVFLTAALSMCALAGQAQSVVGQPCGGALRLLEDNARAILVKTPCPTEAETLFTQRDTPCRDDEIPVRLDMLLKLEGRREIGREFTIRSVNLPLDPIWGRDYPLELFGNDAFVSEITAGTLESVTGEATAQTYILQSTQGCLAVPN